MTSKDLSRAARGAVRVCLPLALALPLGGACVGGSPLVGMTPPPPDSGPPVVQPDAGGDAASPTFCGRGANVLGVVPPTGFCLKTFAQLPEPRALAFAENGDLFVSSPSKSTPGSASGGRAAIVVLFDDDHDGIADTTIENGNRVVGQTFLDGIDDVHGIVIGGGFLYYTTQATVFKTPLARGQRTISGAPIDLKLPVTFAGGGRWTHGLALSQKGELIVSRGEYGQCGVSHGGEISSVAANGALTQLAGGFRNPMYLNCHYKDDVCAAMELGDDEAMGAREKMLVIKPNTNYGFPCCFTKNLAETPGSMCGDIAMEEAQFKLSNTPFGFDWERGSWPAPFKDGLFVALHGSAYTQPLWAGVGIVYAPTSAATHVPVQDWQLFLGGFGPNGSILERPADIKFSADGRMFFADDNGGHVYWVAPTSLLAPG